MLYKDNHFDFIEHSWHHTVCFIAMIAFDAHTANLQWYNTTNTMNIMTLSRFNLDGQNQIQNSKRLRDYNAVFQLIQKCKFKLREV